MSVQVVDKATGEYITLEYASFEDFATQWDELTQRIAALERAKKKMSIELKTMMADEDKLPLGNGWYFRKVTSERKSYPVASVMALLEDDAMKFLKVDKTKLDAELADHADDEGRWKDLSHQLAQSLEVDSVSESLRLIKPESRHA